MNQLAAIIAPTFKTDIRVGERSPDRHVGPIRAATSVVVS